MSIYNLVRPFRREFKTDDSATRNRLCEAFEGLQKELDNLGSSGSIAKNYVKAYNNAATAIPNAVATPIPFNAETSSNGGMHSNTSQNTRITIQRAGLYSITANVQWAAALAGIRQLQIQVNGVNIISSRIDFAQAVAGIQDQIVTGADYFNIGDYIEILAYQTSGAPLNLASVAAFSPYVIVMEN